MKGHCPCEATGLSSHAIARAFDHCSAGGTDHPYDPADLNRCINYCAELEISTEALAERMAPVSRQWAALVAEWDFLVALLEEEMALGTGRAPATYAQMRRLLGRAA